MFPLIVMNPVEPKQRAKRRSPYYLNLKGEFSPADVLNIDLTAMQESSGPVPLTGLVFFEIFAPLGDTWEVHLIWFTLLETINLISDLVDELVLNIYLFI